MMRAAAAHGAELRRAAVTGIARRDGAVAAVETDEGAIPTDAVVIAMGPWSRLAARMAAAPARPRAERPQPRVRDRIAPAARGAVHRISGAPPARAPRPRCSRAPTARPMSARFRRESPVPLDPAEVAPDPGAIERLEAICRALSPVLAESPILAAPGLLPPGDGARPAADRPGAGRRRRLRRHRPQRLGHPQRAGDRRGDGGADRRRGSAHGGSVGVCARTSERHPGRAAARSGIFMRSSVGRSRSCSAASGMTAPLS